MSNESALQTWAEIAQYLRRELSQEKKQILKSSGIIFYRKIGIPPHRQRIVYTFPSLIHQFLRQNKNF